MGVLGTVYQTIDRVVQPILVAANQFAEGGGVPVPTGVDQLIVVGAHSFCVLLDDARHAIVPELVEFHSR
jgi:hypothetical protein